MKKNKSLIEGFEKKPSYGSVWSGDFDSDASEQSWKEFFQIYFTYGPAVATAKEFSSWHGERKLLKYQSPLNLSTPITVPLELPENWKISKISGNMSSSDFLDGVQKDNVGEFISYKSPGGELKFYLPNSEFYNNFTNNVYKFETETGEVYTLVLELNTKRSQNSLILGSDEDTDDITTSLKNLSPQNGNGWYFDFPEIGEIEKGVREYYKKIGGSVLVPFSPSVYAESVKSSWQLFWEKWGVVIQIVLSVVLAYFTSGLSVFIQGLFAEGSIIARLIPQLSSEMLAWLTVNGSFSVARSEVLAMFLLETSVNLPSAFIDKGFENDFGFVLGVAFCFFPFVSTYGRLGKWIKGSYTEEGAKKLAQKILDSGINSQTPPDVIYRLITEELDATEKLMFSEAMKLLSDKEGSQALIDSMKEAMEKALKNKEFPKAWKQFLSGGRYGETIKSFLAAGVFFIDVTKWYIIIKNMANKKGIKETPEEILNNAQKTVDIVKSKFPKTNEDPNFPKTDDIIKNYINGLGEEEGANAIFKLSEGSIEDLLFYRNLIAQKRNEKIKLEAETLQKSGTINDNSMLVLLSKWQEINQNLYEPKSEKDFYQLFNQEELDDSVSQFISKYDNDPMTKEITETVKKYPCLSTNFKYIDGNSWFEGKWALNFEVIKPLSISYKGGIKLDLKTGDNFWIYYPSGIFRVNDFDFEDFSCS